ncbi:MAG: tRNA (cytidine(34)-2'-O)-methyltransferase [Alphaproteobacteria bacterium]|nr:tRNA (cytidine(34)-2'-O)-methyltransferase [Alphaproteobacteria bacterium]
MRLALYEPDIPQNLGAILRLAACLEVPLDVIGPCGFPFDDRRVRRGALDYGARAELVRHASFADFLARPEREAGALVLLTTQADRAHIDYRFSAGDTLLMGRESAGVPVDVHQRAEARLRIPIAPGLRSLNVATAAAIALGEALRQIRGFPLPSREEVTR